MSEQRHGPGLAIATEEEVVEGIRMCMLTQNIGHIECEGSTVSPEQEKTLLDWIATLRAYLKDCQDKGKAIDVLVIHFQEVGGKKFNQAFNELLSNRISTVCITAAWCSGILMPERDCKDTFTAMASCVFIFPQALANVASMLSFKNKTYHPVSDETNVPNVVQGALLSPMSMGRVSTAAMFLGAKFVNAEKSRKGWLLTSLRFGSKVFNFVNLHLFHDADNSVACGSDPSPYVAKRLEAFVECTRELAPLLDFNQDPVFFFGDLNFRLNGFKLVHYFKEVNPGMGPLELGKKSVKASDALWQFFDKPENWETLGRFDEEAKGAIKAVAEASGLELCELPHTFGPTYNLQTDGPDAGQYAHVRVPAWCDRVFMSAAAMATLEGRSKKGTGTPHSPEFQYYTCPLSLMDHRAVHLTFYTTL